jgi:hypothetical protein
MPRAAARRGYVRRDEHLVLALTHLNAVDALKDFPNDPLLGVRATILLRIDWLSGLIGALLW